MGLDIFEMVMTLEKEFGLRLPDEALARMRTVGDLYDYIGCQIAPGLIEPQGGPYSGALWDRYLDVVEKGTGVRSRSTASTRGVRARPGSPVNDHDAGRLTIAATV